MLDKLTKKQIKLMGKVRQKWLDLLFEPCEFNEKGAREGIEWLYQFSGLEQPRIIFVESPLGVQYACNQLQGGAQVRNQVWNQVYDQVRTQVRAQVRNQVWNQVYDQVSIQVGSQVRTQVKDQVGSQVRTQVKDQELTVFGFATYGSVLDFGWLSFYDFFNNVGLEYNNDAWNKFVDLVQTGIYDMVQLDGLCVACKMPRKVYRDAQFRLNSNETPAIFWADGFELYFLDGIHFEKTLWEKITKHRITAEEVAKIQNTEQRVVALKYLSPAEFIKGSKAEQVGLTSERGNTLYKGSFDEVGEVWFLRFKCPSTGREYIEFTQPVEFAESIREVNGQDVDIYNPDVLQAYSFVFEFDGKSEHLSHKDYMSMTVET